MTTYKQAVDGWERSRLALANVMPYTAQKAAQKARLFFPFFGDQEIDAIKPVDIENAMVSLMSEGGRNGNGRSKSTLRQAHMHGQKAVEWAISHEMASINAFASVSRPKGRRAQTMALDTDQASYLMECARSELESNTLGFYTAKKVERASFCMFVLLALSTGMRRGEICALQWSDFDGSYISVSRAVKGGGDIGEPKNASSVRKIAVGENISSLLSAFNVWQSDFRSERKFGDFDPILCDINGERISTNSLEHWWRCFVSNAGFDGLRIHDMRHTHATLLIASGVDVKTVQMRLGHSSADMTMNVYAHAMPRNDVNAASSLDGALLGGRR